MLIEKAEKSDIKQILELQYLAYQSEAKLNNNYSIPPLLQTLEDVEAEFNKGTILKAVDESGNIIGSVRGYIENSSLLIFKLIVNPALQGKGIGTKLLLALEKVYPIMRYELFTSSKSERNIKLYERLGYVRYQEKQISPTLTFVYLEKNVTTL